MTPRSPPTAVSDRGAGFVCGARARRVCLSAILGRRAAVQHGGCCPSREGQGGTTLCCSLLRDGAWDRVPCACRAAPGNSPHAGAAREPAEGGRPCRLTVTEASRVSRSGPRLAREWRQPVNTRGGTPAEKWLCFSEHRRVAFNCAQMVGLGHS